MPTGWRSRRRQPLELRALFRRVRGKGARGDRRGAAAAPHDLPLHVPGHGEASRREAGTVGQRGRSVGRSRAGGNHGSHRSVADSTYPSDSSTTGGFRCAGTWSSTSGPGPAPGVEVRSAATTPASSWRAAAALVRELAAVGRFSIPEGREAGRRDAAPAARPRPRHRQAARDPGASRRAGASLHLGSGCRRRAALRTPSVGRRARHGPGAPKRRALASPGPTEGKGYRRWRSRRSSWACGLSSASLGHRSAREPDHGQGFGPPSSCRGFDAPVATRIDQRVERAMGPRFGPSSKRNAKRSPGPGPPRSRRSSGRSVARRGRSGSASVGSRARAGGQRSRRRSCSRLSTRTPRRGACQTASGRGPGRRSWTGRSF